MMMKRHMLLVGLISLLFSSHTYADLAPCCIYALCQVTLNDGTTIEGVIEVATSIYAGSGFRNLNGFYYDYTEGDDDYYALFTKDFRKIHPNTGHMFYAERQQFWVSTEPERLKNIAYVQDMTKDHVSTAYHVSVEEREFQESNEPFLERVITERIVYKVLNVVPIYATLDDFYASIYFEKPIQPKSIPIHDIHTFELLVHPSATMLKQISVHNSEVDTYYLKLEMDHVLPAWFHDVVTDEGGFGEFGRWISPYPY